MTTRRARKAEAYRLYNNERFQKDLDSLYSLVYQTQTYEFLFEGRRALLDGDYELFHSIICRVRGGTTVEMTSRVSTGAESLIDPIYPSTDGKVSVTGVVTIEIPEKEETPSHSCVDSELEILQSNKIVERSVAPHPDHLSDANPSGSWNNVTLPDEVVVVYMPPGPEKEKFIMNIPESLRGSVYSTDARFFKTAVPKFSVVITSRSDVLQRSHALKIAVLPYRRDWIDQCSNSKVFKPGANLDFAFHHVVKDLRLCFLVRKNCQFERYIKFEGVSRRY